MPDSIEEHNTVFFTTLVRNQAVNSGISHKKVDAMGKNDQEDTSQFFLRHRLCMMLEEWKLEHFCHVRLTTEEFGNRQGFYDSVAEYMGQLENGNVW